MLLLAHAGAFLPLAHRPHHETLKAYVRKLSTLVLEVVESGGMRAQEAKTHGEASAAAMVELLRQAAAAAAAAASPANAANSLPPPHSPNRNRSWTSPARATS